MIMHADILTHLLAAWFWPFARVAAWVGSAPILGDRGVPVRVKLAVALAISVAVAPLAEVPDVDPLGAAGLLVTAREVLIGFALGFTMRLVLVSMEVAGQQLSQVMGLGFASMVEPNHGSGVPLLGQLYVVLATLVFLSVDGHLVLVAVLAESFVALPVAEQGVARDLLWLVAGQAGWVFAAAVLMVLPAVATLLVVNLAFGVMTRSAPQLNVFAVGLPLTLLFGFVVIWATLGVAGDGMQAAFGRAVQGARALIGSVP